MSDILSHISHIQSQLESAYPKDEAKTLAWWIMEEETGLSRTQILTGCKITKNFAHVQEIVDRILHFEPIQYIFGHTLWCGLDLKVTPATLIPRPETAELVEKIAHSHHLIANSRVLDIGTGSGCIAIALKKAHPEWQVTGLDISSEAIEVAKENAKRNGVEVEFKRMDIFSDEIEKICDPHHSPFDIVVSNPPYIRESEKSSMNPNVLNYEPHTALFVPDSDPLRFYRRIASLHMGTCLFFEINEAFAEEMEALLHEQGYTDIRISHDIYGKARIIEGKMQNNLHK